MRSTLGIFFFSSRRRHTRWTGDWSSDVCSSDLSTLRRSCRGPAGTAEGGCPDRRRCPAEARTFLRTDRKGVVLGKNAGDRRRGGHREEDAILDRRLDAGEELAAAGELDRPVGHL